MSREQCRNWCPLQRWPCNHPEEELLNQMFPLGTLLVIYLKHSKYKRLSYILAGMHASIMYKAASKKTWCMASHVCARTTHVPARHSSASIRTLSCTVFGAVSSHSRARQRRTRSLSGVRDNNKLENKEIGNLPFQMAQRLSQTSEPTSQSESQPRNWGKKPINPSRVNLPTQECYVFWFNCCFQVVQAIEDTTWKKDTNKETEKRDISNQNIYHAKHDEDNEKSNHASISKSYKT